MLRRLILTAFHLIISYMSLWFCTWCVIWFCKYLFILIDTLTCVQLVHCKTN